MLQKLEKIYSVDPYILTDACNTNPCLGANTDCINNKDYTRNCTCIDGYLPIGGNPENGCDCKLSICIAFKSVKIL